MASDSGSIVIKTRRAAVLHRKHVSSSLHALPDFEFLVSSL